MRPGGIRSTKRRVLAGIGLVWLVSGIYIVRTEQQAVVTRFGALVEPRVYSGIHYALPWPLDRVTKVKVNQLRRLVVGGDVADDVLGRTQPLASQFLTGDQNIIDIRVVVQYSIAVPADYLFRSFDIVKTIGAVVEAELAPVWSRAAQEAHGPPLMINSNWNVRCAASGAGGQGGGQQIATDVVSY